MYREILLAGCLLLFISLVETVAQQHPNSLSRLDFNEQLAPFYHGVASGDPQSDAIIIWTRITTEEPSVTVSWKLATDTLFTNIVQNGTATTDATRDHTVKIDVTGLQPATYYYYQFEYEGRKSLTGRTKTAPAGDNTHLRFAVVSCANYENGYFNAYEHIAGRNDIDAVLHLGDYIYEYEIGGLPGSRPDRTSEPATEIITLDDYRLRYSHYRLDPQLRAVHQQYPFITTWDDHETANNSWTGGAENHTAGTEGDWLLRKSIGKQAYFEWLPVREDSGDPSRIYRKLNYGQLADIIVLDTRLEGREEQGGTTNQDTSRTLLGSDQYHWLIDQLNDTTAQWKIVAQQVMMGPLSVGALSFEDQWDGYPQERLKLFNYILNNNISNFVVLTGDIHTSWANNLKLPGLNSVGVEFVTPSVTTTNADLVGISINPAILFPNVVKWGDLSKHGYIIVDITKDQVQSDWFFVDTIGFVDPTASVAASWYVNDGARTLQQATGAATGYPAQAALAPLTVDNPTGMQAGNEMAVIVGVYPNPVSNKIILQYYLKQQGETLIQVVDLKGTVLIKTAASATLGINYTQLDLSGIPAGSYLILLHSGNTIYKKAIVKG